LLELFIEFQIPSDLLCFGGCDLDSICAINSVKRNVKMLQLLIETEKIKQIIDSLENEEKTALESFPNREKCESIQNFLLLVFLFFKKIFF
jgi:hypothetical protein